MIVAIILVAASIDWIDACSEVKTDKEMFKRNLTYADMYEYKDSTYDFVIRYPSFFREQPNDAGHARFSLATNGQRWCSKATCCRNEKRASGRQATLWRNSSMPLT